MALVGRSVATVTRLVVPVLVMLVVLSVTIVRRTAVTVVTLLRARTATSVASAPSGRFAPTARSRTAPSAART
jgi:hypothetical protein